RGHWMAPRRPAAARDAKHRAYGQSRGRCRPARGAARRRVAQAAIAAGDPPRDTRGPQVAPGAVPFSARGTVGVPDAATPPLGVRTRLPLGARRHERGKCERRRDLLAALRALCRYDLPAAIRLPAQYRRGVDVLPADIDRL